MTNQSVTSTPTRPQMTKDMAELYRPAMVLLYDKAPERNATSDAASIADWDPIAPALQGATRKLEPDYRVDPGDMGKPDCFASIQQAISHAISEAKSKGLIKRIFIEIAPGTYNELVYIPALEVNGQKGAHHTLWPRQGCKQNCDLGRHRSGPYCRCLYHAFLCGFPPHRGKHQGDVRRGFGPW